MNVGFVLVFLRRDLILVPSVFCAIFPNIPSNIFYVFILAMRLPENVKSKLSSRSRLSTVNYSHLHLNTKCCICEHLSEQCIRDYQWVVGYIKYKRF